MEVDGVAKSSENSVSSASLQNDFIENATVSKNVLSFSDKPFETVTNDITTQSDILDNLESDTLQPSNGDQQSFGHNSSESPELQADHNENIDSEIDSRLESNINIIENQNNENLERDIELIDSNSINSSSSIAKSISESRDTDFGNNDSESVIPESMNLCNEINSGLSGVNIDTQSDREGETQKNPPDSNTENSECSNDLGNVSSELVFGSNKSNSVCRIHELVTNNTDLSRESSEEDLENTQNPEIAMITNNSNTKTLPSSNSIIGEQIKNKVNTNLYGLVDKENSPVATVQRSIGSDTVTATSVSSAPHPHVSNELKELSDCSSQNETNNDTTLNETEKGIEQTLNNPEKSLSLECRGDFSSETREKNPSVIEEIAADQSKELGGAGIELAQVNFDSNDNEKNAVSSNAKGSELDPIGSLTEVDSIANTEGADEAITILPDSEREITEAEKEAASTLPTLKDLSDKTQSVSTTPLETEFAESDIKIYKYDKDVDHECFQCKRKKAANYHFSSKGQQVTYICDDSCLELFEKSSTKHVSVVTDEGLRVKKFTEAPAKEQLSSAFRRKCSSCSKHTVDIESNLAWEIMDFCNKQCLSKYQKVIGSKCASCAGDVKSTSLGKYCVRFGNDIRQFCTSSCLEKYKKGLKVCSYCQQDMSNEPDGFLAPVGEKRQFKDFCSKVCMEKYDIMTNDRPPNVKPGTKCSVCKTEKTITIEFDHQGNINYFCGEPCFVAYAFVNKISPGKCAMCRRHFNKAVLEEHTMYYDNVQHSFCSNSCENIYIIAHRKIVPCSWCKVKKYNFDMIKKYSKTEPVLNMCSINCLNMYEVSLNAVNAKTSPCHHCKKQASPAYHLTMSDATMRNFCSYNCVMNFQNQFPKQIKLNIIGKDPIPTGFPQKNKKVMGAQIDTVSSSDNIPQLPVISSVQSLANTNGSVTPPLLPPGLTPIASTRLTRSKATTLTPGQPSATLQTVHNLQNIQNIDLPVQVQVKQQYIMKEKPTTEQRNVAVMCQPRKSAKSTQAAPTYKDVGIQANREDMKKILIPVPVPIYVPSPCHMFAAPVPIPLPFPLPIPVPIFIPTTRNSAAGIMKEIKKIQVKIPTDPYEAELLMMAEMVAEEKKEEHTDSESDIDDNAADGGVDYSPEPVDSSNTFGDDMLQMALKMATELDEPAVDLEGALTANTITAPQGTHPPESHPQEEDVDDPQPIHPHMMERSPLRGRKRAMRGSPRGTQSKRGRRMSHHQVDMPMIQPVQPSANEPQEKPDANMCLKYTFGVNAWKQWVTTKNAELEKSSRRVKLFKTEILQLTADELNYSLCLFVKEVRKPNGQEYAPDTIYYLCLGIQQYLFENGRIDNIFCDPYYEKFTDCLDEVAKKFSVLYNDSHYIVTRVEEEHLWESKQLGAHSPHVLLSTLMFFNTKHFNLTTVDEHMQLSFSHIMKHWKRNPNQPGASKVPGSRNVLLRFYPPQSALQNNQRKKKVYEQQENEENPLRCPVKLYEFYLSKCPESVKTRNDVFYLQPERSCVPDSPVWYSTMPLPKEALEKMLHRVKMVKEINVALLTS